MGETLELIEEWAASLRVTPMVEEEYEQKVEYPSEIEDPAGAARPRKRFLRQRCGTVRVAEHPLRARFVGLGGGLGVAVQPICELPVAYWVISLKDAVGVLDRFRELAKGVM